MVMQRTWKGLVWGVVLTVALAASGFAAQNVANTSQKGSLLVFPDIDVRQAVDADGNVVQNFATIIRIANDGNQAIDVKCYYVNEVKGRADFMFKLTRKQPFIFNAGNGQGDPINVAAFPLQGTLGVAGANPARGELICFAVDIAGSAQVSWNHLSGTATVFDFLTGAAYEYNSWNFTARAGTPRQPHGDPGNLQLTGADDGASYDACPLYNIVHFSPTGGTLPGTAVAAQATNIAVSTCLQDLRQDFTPHWTKIVIPVWNADEVKFTGAFECANSTHHFQLETLDRLPQNTTFATLGSFSAHLQLRGITSTQCVPFLPAGAVTEDTGLLASVSSITTTGGEAPVLQKTGVTTNTAGVSAVPGFVLWDPQDAVVPERR